MKPLRIFRHHPNEGPGYLAEYLDARGVPYELVCLDQGEAVPPRVDDVAGLVFMGGPMSVNDDLPWIAQELSLIRRAAQAGLPVLGHCLGGQLISKALGGTVTPNPVKEIGWHPVWRAPVTAMQGEAELHGLTALPDPFEVFHWHGETFTFPHGATPLLEGRHCANQGFVIGKMLALQCHIEMTEAMVKDWIEHGQADIASPSASVQSAREMTLDLTAKVAKLHSVAEIIYSAWLKTLSVGKNS